MTKIEIDLDLPNTEEYTKSFNNLGVLVIKEKGKMPTTIIGKKKTLFDKFNLLFRVWPQNTLWTILITIQRSAFHAYTFNRITKSLNAENAAIW